MRVGQGGPPPTTVPLLFRVPRVADRRRPRSDVRRRFGLMAALWALCAAPVVGLVLHVAWQWFMTAREPASLGPWPVAGVRRPAAFPSTPEWQNVATIDARPEPEADATPPGRRIGQRGETAEERR